MSNPTYIDNIRNTYMSNRLTTLNISQDFYEYVSKKASMEERSIAQYIRNAVKTYSGYEQSTLAVKIQPPASKEVIPDFED